MIESKYVRKFKIEVGAIPKKSVESFLNNLKKEFEKMREIQFEPIDVEKRIINLENAYNACLQVNNKTAAIKVLNDIIKHMTEKIIKDHCK